jgi:S-adenosylmethionine uptake transporter
MKPASHLVPVLAAACGIATFSVMDALMKGASMQVGVFTALMGRCVLGAALSLPAWWAMERGGSYGRHGRCWGFTLSAALWCWAWPACSSGVVRTPLAVGMALSFISPLIALYLSALFLGEAITRRAGRFADCAAGRGRGGGGRRGRGAAWRFAARAGGDPGAAVLYAANLVVQRHQAQRAAPARSPFSRASLSPCSWPPPRHGWGDAGQLAGGGDDLRRRCSGLGFGGFAQLGLGAGAGASAASGRV